MMPCARAPLEVCHIKSKAENLKALTLILSGNAKPVAERLQYSSNEYLFFVSC